MTTVVYKPRIQCRYRDGEDRRCPPDILGEGGLLEKEGCRRRRVAAGSASYLPRAPLRLPTAPPSDAMIASAESQ